MFQFNKFYAMASQVIIFVLLIGISLQECVNNCKEDITRALKPYNTLEDAPLGVVYWNNAGCLYANLTCTGMDLVTIEYEQEDGGHITVADSDPRQMGLITLQGQLECKEYGWNAHTKAQVIKNDIVGCYVMERVSVSSTEASTTFTSSEPTTALSPTRLPTTTLVTSASASTTSAKETTSFTTSSSLAPTSSSTAAPTISVTTSTSVLSTTEGLDHKTKTGLNSETIALIVVIVVLVVLLFGCFVVVLILWKWRNRSLERNYSRERFVY